MIRNTRSGILVLSTIIFLAIFLSSCAMGVQETDISTNDAKVSNEPAITTPVVVPTAKPDPETVTISWEFTIDSDNDYQFPYLEIFLIEDSNVPRKTMIYKTIGSIYEVSDREAWQIPAEAEYLFYTFYAGAGAVFYTKMEDTNVFTIMYRFIDEMDMEPRPFEPLVSFDYEDDVVVDILDPIGFVN